MDSNAVFAAATASLLSGKEFEDLRNHFGLTKVDMAVIAVAMQKHGTLGAMYQNEPAMFAVLSLKLRPVLKRCKSTRSRHENANDLVFEG